MSQVLRYHKRGSLAVPGDLIDAIDWAFGVSDGDPEEFGLYPEEATELRCLVLRPFTEAATVAAPVLCDARNVLDSWTLSDECRDADTGKLDARDNGAPVGEGCGFCLWCQCLVMRDWCDALLDRAGFPLPPYHEMTPADYDPVAHFRRLVALASGRHSTPAAAGEQTPEGPQP